MSRIGRQLIVIPEGVQVVEQDGVIKVTGPKGELQMTPAPGVLVQIESGKIICQGQGDSKQVAANWGTMRARLANMVTGVTEGFSKDLELHGVGYKAAVLGRSLELNIGFSHPVKIEAPEGIDFAVAKEVITVSGADKVQVGQVAADIRAARKPEPYKGKGIRYRGEQVRRKVGKVVGTVV